MVCSKQWATLVEGGGATLIVLVSSIGIRILFCEQQLDYTQNNWIDGATGRHRILALGFGERGGGLKPITIKRE